MLEALKPLLEGGLLNDETRTALSEAWETKLNEAREQIRGEIREEFAGRYEHDKNLMVEALDKMVSESLSAQVEQLVAEKKALSEDRVRFAKKMNETGVKFSDFMTTKLAEEIKEFRSDRSQHKAAAVKLESFVMKALAEELVEFQTDKRDLVETKVKLIANANTKLDEMKSKFVARSSKLVQEAIAKQLRAELTQLREDINSARKNAFGRKIFEAFASEFTTTHLNENAEIRKLMLSIKKKDKVIAEAANQVHKAVKLVESKDKELKSINERSTRAKIMSELMNPLNKDKQNVMSTLLENVQTDRLKSAFEKYLPSVLNNDTVAAPKKVLSEGVAVTGDKKAAKAYEADDKSNIIDIKRLAGLK